jgi:hypothetical protein
MSTSFPGAEVESAIEALDAARLLRMLDEGLDPNWQGPCGNTLLHAAARIGDALLVERLLEKGARAFVHNEEAETPRDVAASWGHDALARRIGERLEDEKLTRGPAAIPCQSLQQIREKSLESGISHFHYLAQRGQFAQVVTLAANDPQGFTAADLLAKGLDGDTVIMKVCQQGQLPLLMKPELWVKKPQEFQAVWEQVPEHYRKQVDYDSFVSQLRQIKLQSYGKPKLKGFGK